LQEQAAQAGLTDKITFAGQVSDEDLRAYYAACCIFAFPSIERSEAFGLVQLEAMAAGKPVVNTDVNSGVPYVSVHEETGLTAKVGDMKSLAGHLNTLRNNEHLQAHYGNAARRRVFEKFTLEKMSSQVLAVYSEAMNKASRRAIAAAATA
jgi:rhamnosyl/mannosyltransferase